MFLYGINSILERLKINPGSIKKIFLAEQFKDTPIFISARQSKIVCEVVKKDKLDKISKGIHHQGIAAQIEEFNYANFDELLVDKNHSFIFLDRLTDPQNLGSILRTAACLGNLALVLPKYKACPITETVLRVACGAENYAPVCLVSNLSNTLIKAKQDGYWVVGASSSEGELLTAAKLPFPLCLVLGSEGEGIRYGIDKHLDMRVMIPMSGSPLTFNVAVAAAIFGYEITRQRLIH